MQNTYQKEKHHVTTEMRRRVREALRREIGVNPRAVMVSDPFEPDVNDRMIDTAEALIRKLLKNTAHKE